MCGRESSVLVVDDDPDIRDMMAEVLEANGCSVTTASDGAEALQVVDQSMPDVILLDMRMPVMNGWEFAKRFRASHDHCARIVVVTAAADARERAKEVGAEGWLA